MLPDSFYPPRRMGTSPKVARDRLIAKSRAFSLKRHSYNHRSQFAKRASDVSATRSPSIADGLGSKLASRYRGASSTTRRYRISSFFSLRPGNEGN